MTTTTQPDLLPWLIIARIGHPLRETLDFVEMNTVVIAQHSTEAEAERERDRRKRRRDGRWYFVMSSHEYAQATYAAQVRLFHSRQCKA